MGLDFSLLKPVEIPSILDSQQKAMALSQLGLQNQALARDAQIKQQSLEDSAAMKRAFANNLNPDGTVNQAGALSQLAKESPTGLMAAREHFNKSSKDEAESQSAKMKALHDQATIAVPHYGYLLGLDDNAAAQAYPSVLKSLSDGGVDTTKLPQQWDRPTIKRGFDVASHYKEQMDNRKTGADTNKTVAETKYLPEKMQAELNASQFGSRSPNAELSSQYGKDIGPIRSSQMAMNQMLDNYKNPSPQGDASLILNAFKIKFPTAPDVNSLEELTKAQAVPDSWKQAAAHALQGGLDQGTRDNLMRDAVSTYRANYDSYQGIKSKYDARAKFQNVNDPTMTYEPAIEKTYANAMDLQKNIGPYVPPAERPGLIGRVTKFLGGSEKTANAADKKPDASTQNQRKVGSKVTGPEVGEYAIKHGMTEKAAKDYLRGAGYVVD